jgi:Integrase core domain
MYDCRRRLFTWLSCRAPAAVQRFVGVPRVSLACAKRIETLVSQADRNAWPAGHRLGSGRPPAGEPGAGNVGHGVARAVLPGLVHHSDRGARYACGDYTQRLERATEHAREGGIQPGMSRPGRPWDNAMAESFMRTLKREEVDGRTYRDIEDARGLIATFLEEVYNRQRLHAARSVLEGVRLRRRVQVQAGTKKRRVQPNPETGSSGQSQLGTCRTANDEGLSVARMRSTNRLCASFPSLTAGVQFTRCSPAGPGSASRARCAVLGATERGGHR